MATNDILISNESLFLIVSDLLVKVGVVSERVSSLEKIASDHQANLEAAEKEFLEFINEFEKELEIPDSALSIGVIGALRSGI